MTELLPTGRILIQRAGRVPVETGQADFLVFPIADQAENAVGLVSQCEVEFSSTVENTAATAAFEIDNLHPNTVRAMAELGYVKILAGYIGHEDRPPQIIFFGRLETWAHRFVAGSIKWTFSANAFPTDIWAIRPHATQPRSNTGGPQRIKVGEAVRILADRIGIGRENVRMPRIFDGDLSDTDIKRRPDLAPKATETFVNAITLETWSTRDTAIEELQKLMQRVSLAVKETFGVVRNYSLLPNVNNPYRIVIGDVNVYSGESLNLDLDSPTIISAGPVESAASTPATVATTDAADDLGQAEPAATVVTVKEYGAAMPFDPKVAMGVLIKGRSTKFGLNPHFRVTKGKHQLNGSPMRWRTECQGTLQPEVSLARSS